MAISFNPMQTINGAGTFRVTSDGYVQGTTMDDPSARYRLAGGLLAATETLPMWGGVGVFSYISGGTNPNGADVLGGSIGRSLTIANMAGISVFDQNHSMIQAPFSEVPCAQTAMTVNFYKFGSQARIAVQCDPAIVASVGSGIASQFSWDFNQQRLVPYAPVTANENITSITWSGGVATVTTSAAHGYVVGNDVTISGAVPAGFNGDFAIVTVPSSTTFTYALAVSPGTETTPGIVVAGGGLMPVKVLNINVGNSKTVTYDTVNNLVHWNENGACALIQI